ncbi:bone morphogenetic protein receptor type-2-like [Parambassis ranga]|uniref:receptor protein serine/threonine kinase n=1 Tax=Parambassis ranga TaxID=210632 RepID=A0A6P7KJB6_9TELE|nr:bone morphogenetic protein receptor type-2-like [Parambassis ranga]
MASSVLTCVCVLLLPAVTGFQSEDAEHRLCAFTNSPRGAGSVPTNELRGVVQENGTIRCSRGSRCYGLWEKRADGEMQLLNQGCWTHVGHQQECHGDRCLLVTSAASQMQKANYRFCCCSRDLCNTNYTEAPPTEDTPALKLMKTDGREDGQTDHQLTAKQTALISLVTVAIAAIIIMVLFLGYRMIKRKQKHSLSAVDVMEAANSQSAVDLHNLKLLELIGRGRYGTVFRGSLNECCVAIKLFSAANRQNFTNECSIYCLPLLQQHDNIARFLSGDERTAADGRPEFLIVMEHYPHGCLSQYLSLHTVDWSSCCRMTHGLTRGLAFLHTEICRGDQYKPAVAHRDLTSRNVLVRANRSCVLADFGLSMRLAGLRPCRPGDDDTMAISEVGTVRYMSPEVLGGALNLRDCESALKQVDVYALGLLYWETFRRCSDLFPGEAVPEYQLAFQAELGNHPTFEDMQVLVVREKYRPRFPEAWKENSLVLRSLKETMEDCWDQDAEARLTAQCAEERLSELALLGAHTAVHNHRNLSHGRCAPHGPASSYIEDLQVGVVKNLQGDGHTASVIKTRTCGGDEGGRGGEKNRNSINFERQQAQTRLSTLACSMPTSSTTLMPATFLCTISESHSGGAVPSVPVCLQLTEEDLEATKLDPKEVDKNLTETSEENLMEHSQKFGSEPQATSLLYHQILHGAEAHNPVSSSQGELNALGVQMPPCASIHPLPKQQNLPQRPTTLHLLAKARETCSASPQLMLGKLKSNHRQVETGVAKMNTVAVAAEPHLVTTVTNNTNMRSCTSTAKDIQPATGVASSYSAGVPNLVTNSMIGGGWTNPAGPQLEEEDKVEAQMSVGVDTRLNLLNFSPDEHEPLLRREQLPAESDPPPREHTSGRGSNSNNNNNRLPLDSEVKVQHLQVTPAGDSPKAKPQEASQQIHVSAAPLSRLDGQISSDKGLVLQAPPPADDRHERLDPPPFLQKAAEAEFVPGHTHNSKDQLIHSAEASTSSKATVAPAQTPSSPEAPATGPEASPPADPASETKASESRALIESSAPEPPGPACAPQTACLMPSQGGLSRGRRPERPCSLDLSSVCISPDDVSMVTSGSLSASGEKIKRRVKTPYTLKKWRPASWVVSTDTALDPSFEFNTSSSGSSQTHFPSVLQRAGSGGRINQSKSSMAVFLVGGGATATTTSESDGMTCF